MVDDPKGLVDAAGKTVSDYAWLVADVLILLVLATFSLGYADCQDGKLQGLLRLGLVAAMWYFALSGFHILVWIRHVGHFRNAGSKGKAPPLHWGWAWGITFLKVAVLVLLFFGAEGKGYL